MKGWYIAIPSDESLQIHSGNWITKINGIRLLTLPSALLHCTPLMYTNSSTDMQAAGYNVPEINPFGTFLAYLTQAGLNGTPVASLVETFPI